MDIRLEPFEIPDLPHLELWQQQINSDLYISRITPKVFDGKTTKNEELWHWFKVLADGETVGTLWLEKETATDLLYGKHRDSRCFR